MRADEVIPLEPDLGGDAARVLEGPPLVELEVEVTKYLEPFLVVGHSAEDEWRHALLQASGRRSLLSHDLPPEKNPLQIPAVQHHAFLDVGTLVAFDDHPAVVAVRGRATA